MRILFVKTSSLGDVIHNCPAVSDVHRLFPDAGIDWVVEEAFADVAAMHVAISRVIPVAVRRWRRRLVAPSTWREMRAFRLDLRSQQYDLIIDTQGLLKSALISRVAFGPRHGFDATSAREPIASRFYDICHQVSKELHAVARNRELTATAIGSGPYGPCNYGLVPRTGESIACAKRYCVLLSMTSRPEKLWPEHCWIELAQALAGRGFECILPWGSEAERARCTRIVAGGGHGTVPSALSVGQIGGLMSMAHGVFGVDTGLAHLAAALGVPSIGIFCSTDPAKTGLYGGRNVANLGGPGRVPASGEAVVAFEAMG